MRLEVGEEAVVEGIWREGEAGVEGGGRGMAGLEEVEERLSVCKGEGRRENEKVGH